MGQRPNRRKRGSPGDFLAAPWTSELIAIRRKVEAVAGVCFNSVLLNLYRTDLDSVSWHSDDEPELGIDPTIASVSFGAASKFQFKHKTNLGL